MATVSDILKRFPTKDATILFSAEEKCSLVEFLAELLSGNGDDHAAICMPSGGEGPTRVWHFFEYNDTGILGFRSVFTLHYPRGCEWSEPFDGDMGDESADQIVERLKAEEGWEETLAEHEAEVGSRCAYIGCERTPVGQHEGRWWFCGEHLALQSAYSAREQAAWYHWTRNGEPTGQHPTLCVPSDVRRKAERLSGYVITWQGDTDAEGFTARSEGGDLWAFLPEVAE